MKKIIAIVMAALMVAASFAGCKKDNAKSSSASSTANKKLIVGITEYEPMDYKDDNGEWTGFDAEFARNFAKTLNREAEFIVIDWDNKFAELNSGAIDCIWNGMTITDEVKKNTSVSDPYVQNKQVVVMKSDKVDNYKDAASMKGLKFAAESGSAGEGVAKDNGYDVTAVTAQSDALLEVKAGSCDACVIDATMAAAMTGDGTDYSNLKAGITLNDELYGVGFKKGSDLTAKFNEYLAKVKADGSLKTLADKYNLNLAE